MEVVWFYFRHGGSTAALPADDLADYILQFTSYRYIFYLIVLYLKKDVCMFLLTRPSLLGAAAVNTKCWYPHHSVQGNVK